jgi:hypothetical protein
MLTTLEELGYCGADCSACHIYRSVHFGEALPAETMDRWREDAKKFWGMDNLEAKQLNCRGCRHDHKGVFFAFTLCPIRACAQERGVISCGYCPEMKTCERLDVPESKANLERAALKE